MTNVCCVYFFKVDQELLLLLDGQYAHLLDGLVRLEVDTGLIVYRQAEKKRRLEEGDACAY